MITTLLLLFLALLFTSTSPQYIDLTEFDFDFHFEERFLSSWVVLDSYQADTNPHIQHLLYTGVQNATQKAIYYGYLARGTYSIAQVLKIEQDQDATKTQDYRFTVDISNGEILTLTIVFELSYDPAKGTSEITSYWFPGQETDTNTETEAEQFFSSEEGVPWGYFWLLDLDKALADPQIQKLLHEGFRKAVESAIQEDWFPSGVYHISKVNSISLDAFDEYRFDVNISSGDSNPPVNNFFFAVQEDLSSGIYVGFIGLGIF